MNLNELSSFKAIVDQCTSANDPVPGIFWVAQCAFTDQFEINMANAALIQLLNVASEKGVDCFDLRDTESILQAARTMDLPEFSRPPGNPIEVELIPNEKAPTALVPGAWSVAGFLCYMQKSSALRQVLNGDMDSPVDRLPGFTHPAELPVTENFIAARGLESPLGQWLPAFKDGKGRIHDLFDLSAECLYSPGFLMASMAVRDQVDAPSDVKAGYLARQAAHAHDIAIRDHLPMRRVAKPEEVQNGPATLDEMIERTGLRSETCLMVAMALLNGAIVSQSAWSGEGENARPFGHNSGLLKELVHSLGVFADQSHGWDGQRALAIKRMHAEGHDVVIAHADHADRNRSERFRVLPLHLWADHLQPLTVAALLQAGADTKALVYDTEGVPDEGRSVYEVLAGHGEDADEIVSMIRSAEARLVAMATIREMASQDAPLTHTVVDRKP